jgi:hypothetical protein
VGIGSIVSGSHPPLTRHAKNEYFDLVITLFFDNKFNAKRFMSSIIIVSSFQTQ